LLNGQEFIALNRCFDPGHHLIGAVEPPPAAQLQQLVWA